MPADPPPGSRSSRWRSSMPADPSPTPRFSGRLEEHLRAAAATRRRGRLLPLPPLRAVVPVAAVAAAVALVVGTRVGDDEPERGASSTDLPVLRLKSRDLLKADRAEIERLQAEFRKRGALLGVRDKWVK